MSVAVLSLPERCETGALGVCHLKRFWARMRARADSGSARDADDERCDVLVADALGVGKEQVLSYLFQQAPDFADFERWIVATAGVPAPELVARINAAVLGETPPAATRQRLEEIEAMPPALDAADLAHWREHGYVILHEAVPAETCQAAAEAIWRHLSANPEDPDTWYAPMAQGIMSTLFQDPAFTANRHSPRIHKAFAQLWGTADLWVTCDRGGFNPPVRPGWTFRASDLHWDVSLVRPWPFGTQGILYLVDTPENQGAFRCVPGFHRRIDAWLEALPAGADPREQNLHALGVRHIAGRAGDLVIWNDLLPHGASPNRGTRPRLVQYLNRYPTHRPARLAWA